MKRVAILVIASTRQPVYVHYLETYWTRAIRHTNAELPHLSIFLLFEHDAKLDAFPHLENNIIQDPESDYARFCRPGHQGLMVPGVLLKTVHAFDLLKNRYDLFFRTNLSSMLKLSAFDGWVQSTDDIGYSSAFVWTDALRQQLQFVGEIGPGRPVESLDELDEYEGDSFGSGCGYFLNREEARSLVARRDRIRWDIVDDVSIGLMFPRCEVLPGFTHIARPDRPLAEVVGGILRSDAVHVRLQHFPLQKARSLWEEIGEHEIWD